MEAVKINGSQRSKYNNPLHAQFNDHLYDTVTASQVAMAKIPALLISQWRAAIDTEIDINREVQASAITALMAAKDDERDELITHIFGVVRNQCRSPFQSNKDSANNLVIYVDKYGGLQYEANDVKTMHIKGFVIDMRMGLNISYLSDLGLVEVVTMLEEANNDYESLKASRTTERAAKTLPSSIVARRETDKLYSQLCNIIEAVYLMSTDADEKQRIAILVTEMNQYIDETKATYHQMASASSGADESTDSVDEPTDSGDPTMGSVDEPTP